MASCARDRDGVTAVVATILLLGIVMVLAATIFILAVEFRGGSDEIPQAYAFGADLQAGTIRVNAAPTDAHWERLSVTGCTGVPTGAVSAGQVITGCAGHVEIRDTGAHLFLVGYDFPSG